MTNKSIAQLKLKQAQALLTERGENSIWIIAANNNHQDPCINLFQSSVSTRYAFLITPNKAIAVVAGLDEGNIAKGVFDNIITYASERSFDDAFEDGLKNVGLDLKDVDLDITKTTAYLNINRKDPLTDCIPGGLLQKIELALLDDDLNSASIKKASKLMYELFSVKTPEEIDRIRYVAEAASDILDDAMHKIRVGMTEKDVFNLIDEAVTQYNAKPGVVPVTYKEAFGGGQCPIIVSGERFSELKSAHGGPLTRTIQSGDTVYADFGVTANGYSSDIQRMVYMQKENEASAPAEITKMFKTLYDSVEAALKEIKPGVIGHIPDSAARKVIKDAGYPDYPHGTGHQVGNIAHAPGALLANIKSGNIKYQILGALPLLENSIVTVEPRIMVENGMSIEEDILVTRDGPEVLSKRQTEIWSLPYNPISAAV